MLNSYRYTEEASEKFNQQLDRNNDERDANYQHFFRTHNITTKEKVLQRIKDRIEILEQVKRNIEVHE